VTCLTDKIHVKVTHTPDSEDTVGRKHMAVPDVVWRHHGLSAPSFNRPHYCRNCILSTVSFNIESTYIRHMVRVLIFWYFL
jgi:hypothetical protein